MFKKNNKSTIEEIILSDKPEQIEIVDLTNDKIENTLETRKENRIIFLIIGFIVLFVLLLPTFTGIFKKTNRTITTNAGKIVSKDTNDGFLEIGSENGSITALKIQFYSFHKRTDNTISYVYLSDSSYKNIKELNIYIEIYNNKKSIIYRELFNPSENIERSRNTAYIKLNESLYSEAAYAKITILEKTDFNVLDKSLVCRKKIISDIYTIDSTVTYNFSTNGLINYTVNKTAEITDKNSETSDSLTVFNNEKDLLEKYNFSDFDFTDSKIKYTVDLINGNYEGYKLLYPLGSTIRKIKLQEESSNWSCV